jgi:hypothetical protein
MFSLVDHLTVCKPVSHFSREYLRLSVVVRISVAARGLDLPLILAQNVNGARITADLPLRTAANGHKKASKEKIRFGNAASVWANQKPKGNRRNQKGKRNSYRPETAQAGPAWLRTISAGRELSLFRRR